MLQSKSLQVTILSIVINYSLTNIVSASAETEYDMAVIQPTVVFPPSLSAENIYDLRKAGTCTIGDYTFSVGSDFTAVLPHWFQVVSGTDHAYSQKITRNEAINENFQMPYLDTCYDDGKISATYTYTSSYFTAYNAEFKLTLESISGGDVVNAYSLSDSICGEDYFVGNSEMTARDDSLFYLKQLDQDFILQTGAIQRLNGLMMSWLAVLDYCSGNKDISTLEEDVRKAHEAKLYSDFLTERGLRVEELLGDKLVTYDNLFEIRSISNERFANFNDILRGRILATVGLRLSDLPSSEIDDFAHGSPYNAMVSRSNDYALSKVEKVKYVDEDADLDELVMDDLHFNHE